MVILIFLACSLYGQQQISDSLLRNHVSALAHDSMEGRLTGTQGEIRAARYIYEYMRAIDLKPVIYPENGFLVPWSVKDQKGLNLAGCIPGSESPDTLILFSAHYDHIGTTSSQKALPFGKYSKKVKGDTIFNGANDDVSGVAAMLELARVFKQQKPRYTLVFAAFSGEEEGMLGSADFALRINPAMVLQNINLEMLGRPMGKRPFITENDTQEFRNRLNRNLFAADPSYGKRYFDGDPFEEQRLFERSDNYSFAKAGIPANTIMATSPYDRYYHSAEDDFSNIAFGEMYKIVQAIYLAVLPMVLNPYR